jgi:hypothetical protein
MDSIIPVGPRLPFGASGKGKRYLTKKFLFFAVVQ